MKKREHISSIIDRVFSSRKHEVERIIENFNPGEANFLLSIQTEIIKSSQRNVMYCNLTGQSFGYLSDAEIEMLLVLHGLDKTEAFLSNKNNYSIANGIAPHWKSITPETLNHLMRIDPIGYFIYSASKFLTKPHVHSLPDLRRQQQTEYENLILTWKIALHEFLKEEISIEVIAKANNAWQLLLAAQSPYFIKTNLPQLPLLQSFFSEYYLNNFPILVREILIDLCFTSAKSYGVQAVNNIFHASQASHPIVRRQKQHTLMQGLMFDINGMGISMLDIQNAEIDRLTDQKLPAKENELSKAEQASALSKDKNSWLLKFI